MPVGIRHCRDEIIYGALTFGPDDHFQRGRADLNPLCCGGSVVQHPTDTERTGCIARLGLAPCKEEVAGGHFPPFIGRTVRGGLCENVRGAGIPDVRKRIECGQPDPWILRGSLGTERIERPVTPEITETFDDRDPGIPVGCRQCGEERGFGAVAYCHQCLRRRS